jgi:putative heme-binding domain-containing protein
LAPGFDVTLVREAGADEGSWVSLAFDPQGSITIAREDRGLLGMTLSQDCTKVVEVKTLNETLAECRGLLYAYGYLFVSANNSKGLYRLRDSDGDRFFDEEQLLRNFPGGAGHGRNDLVLGPDGMIYVIHGDSVDIPTADVSDLTSPLREARRGGKTSEGHVVRTDRDGASWEVVCGGLRNPFGIAFNRHGDCFTYDADAEFDMGTPWYRPTRVVQLMPGADYGWRGVTGKWPPYDPDQPTSTPAILDIGKGSPTAVMFGEQLRFPEDYRNALFVLDWAYGRVMAVHLMPRGTTYRARAETFLQGRPLNVTDIATGPDGALYLITGGRKTQSALYRVTYKGVLPIAPGESASSDHEQRCAPFASTARQLRRSLELLGPELEFRSAEPESTEPDPVKLIADSLSSFDPWLRAAARTALEKQSAPFMAAVGGEVTSINGQLEYFLAGMRLRPQDFAASTIGYCLTLDDQDLSLGQAWTVAYLYAQCWQEAPESIRPQRSRVVSHVEYLFRQATSNRQVNAAATDRKVAYQCAELLVQLEAEHVVDVVSASLLRSASQEDRLQGLLVLRSQASGWTNALRREFFTALNDGESFLRGEGMPKFLSQIREEALRTFSEQERAELESILEAPRERSLPPLEPRRGAIVKQWRVSDFEQLLGDGEHVPDRQRGARIFQEALCDRCHQAGARGPAIGPDLTYVSRRFSRHDLLLSLLEPSAVVAENYRSVRILLQDGRVIVGRLLAEGDYRSEKLQIAVDWLRPLDVLEVDKKDIESIQESDESPMPASLLDSFQVEEILDLLYYLTSDI